MARQSWLDTFPDCKLMNTIAGVSDHSPIIMALFRQETLKKMTLTQLEGMVGPQMCPLIFSQKSIHVFMSF